MRPLNIKDRCTKKKLKKSDEVIRTYDKIQTAYAEILDSNPNIQSIRCNVPLPLLIRKMKKELKFSLLSSLALPFSSSFSETEGEDGKEEAFSFLIPFLFRELEVGMKRRKKKRKRKAGKTPGYRPIVGITDPYCGSYQYSFMISKI